MGFCLFGCSCSHCVLCCVLVCVLVCEAISRSCSKLARPNNYSPNPPQVRLRGHLGGPWLVLGIGSRRVCKRMRSSARLGVGRAFARRSSSLFCSGDCLRPCIFSARRGCRVSLQCRHCKSVRFLRKSTAANSPRRLGVFRGCRSVLAVRLAPPASPARRLSHRASMRIWRGLL